MAKKLSRKTNRLAFELVYLGQRGLTSKADSFLNESGLGRSHFRVLFALKSDPGMTTNEILERLQIKPQSLSATMNQLLKLKFVQQNLDQNDRRLRRHFLTAAGEKIESRVVDIQSDRLAKAVNESSLKLSGEFLTLLYYLCDTPVRDRLADQFDSAISDM